MAARLPPHVIRRRNLLYAHVQIPKSLRKVVGKAALQQSLGTDSVREAAILAPPIVAVFKRAIETARSGQPQDSKAREKLRYILELERATLPTTVFLGSYQLPREDYLKDAALDAADTSEEKEAVELEFGSLAILKEHVEPWLLTLELAPKTKDQYSTVIRQFSQQFRTNKDVTSLSMSQWVATAWAHKSKTTIRRDLGAIRGFWKYLSVRKFGDPSVLPNIFSGAATLGHQKKRVSRAFTTEEYHQLLSACEDQRILDTLKLAIHTGIRLERLHQLRVLDVENQVFLVRKGKTDASRRMLPVHKDITQLVARLIDESKDGYLLTGYRPNKYGRRSWDFSKRFARLLSKFEFNSETSFHSFRKSFVTQLEANQVPIVEVQRLIGHGKMGLAYDIYSSGPAIEVLRAEINKLKF